MGNSDGSVAREILQARAQTARAALRALQQETDTPTCQSLQRDYGARVRLAESGEDASLSGGTSPGQLQIRAVIAQREALSALRRTGVIGDDAFHAVEEEIDLIELTADERIRPPL